jgi:hypothetical protein
LKGKIVHLNVLNLENKTVDQLHSVIDATGSTVHSFYSWVHRTRFVARTDVKKIKKIEESIAYADYSPAVKLELRNKRELATATFDACELIMGTLRYTPTERVHLTRDTIEQMFADACNEEEKIAFEAEFK